MTISPEATKVITNHARIVEYATINKVPCYIASVPLGMSPKDYITGLLGLDQENPEHAQVKNILGKTDFNNYMKVLQDPEASTSQLALFEPIFAFPEGTRDAVRTLRIVFEKPHEAGLNDPSFF